MLQRNLVYTGVTRGKKLVVLVGQKESVAIAVRNVSGRRRWSKLSGWHQGSNRHRKRIMNTPKVHHIWMEQCEAARTEPDQDGAKAAAPTP
jgi:hypothetical protein